MQLEESVTALARSPRQVYIAPRQQDTQCTCKYNIQIRSRNQFYRGSVRVFYILSACL